MQESRIELDKLEWAILVKNVDRILNVERSVIHKVKINIYFKGYIEKAKIDIYNIEKVNVIPDMLWLCYRLTFKTSETFTF